MSLQEIKKQAEKLSINDRLALVNLIIDSLQSELNNQIDQTQSLGQPSVAISGAAIGRNLPTKQKALIQQMRGFLKTDKSAPCDTEIEAMLAERLVEKYLQ